MKNEKIPE
jgi:glycine dehydrogenase